MAFPAGAASRGRCLLLALAVIAAPAFAATTAPVGAPEATLREDLQGARWPADIVRTATHYLTAQPYGPASEAARSELDRARSTMRLLERSDIRLYRADFAGAGAVVPQIADDVRKAALADKEAALRVAHHHRDRAVDARSDGIHYIGWLQYSAALGNAAGSYELALHYRKDNQPALAAPYEARAEELGFKIPTTLDNVRK
jgi:hypothetical protein